MAMSVQVRPFTKRDVPDLLDLMRQLAVFEAYIDDFRVTEDDLIDHGLGASPRFGAFVADDGCGRLLGMAVHYVIPWTYDLKPTLVLKELFVVEHARGLGVGRDLMEAVLREGRRIGARRVNWTVLAGNTPAETFYNRIGGQIDAKWRPWGIVLPDQPDKERHDG